MDAAFFDEGSDKWEQTCVSNDLAGYKELVSWLPEGTQVAMEATGPYYVQLATYLYEHGYTVSVVNPLQVKRYSQMKLSRAKTDAVDARVIAEYAAAGKAGAWAPDDKAITQLRQLHTALESIDKQISMNQNQLEAFTSTGVTEPFLMKELKSLLASLKAKKKKLEAHIEKLVASQYRETAGLLRSVPGIGPRSAALIIIVTNNFQKFSNHKQLIAFVGLSPTIRQSGTSIKAAGGICKMGNPQVRRALYMASLSAAKKLPAARAMSERMKAKGKPGKVINIAIANKLLKTAFAVVNKKQAFDQIYQPKPCF